ncbi:hypothetical protein Pcinc_037534 [Petrolisthes cinctipes]|uniref:Dynein heavy chain tail domain-containing protein n=1 Tax=Petrolisthes cinctipes TaxID=88211 RepID=A0AAE1BSL3_PETCI|nr:hypothetical protein Pcinc_037534 [Petrolisthes cinctipes]
MSARERDQETLMKSDDVDGSKEEDENKDEDDGDDVEDLRSWWVTRRVCHLLGYSYPTRPSQLLWPQQPDHHHPPALLTRFLDKGVGGSWLVFWAPHDDQPVATTTTTTTTTLTYPPASQAPQGYHHHHHQPNLRSDGDKREDIPDGDVDPKTSTRKSAAVGPLLHVQETGTPCEVGARGGVLVRKVVGGVVPDVANSTQAHDLLPQHLHLTYLHHDTHTSLHTVFSQVYVPLSERLGKNDRTSYLASLAHSFSTLSELRPPDPAIDYDSDEDEETQKEATAVPRGLVKEVGELEGEETKKKKKDDQQGGGGGGDKSDDEEQKKVKSPATLLMNNIKRYTDKFSQGGGSSSTLGDLKATWSNNFMQLSSALAHLHSHPLCRELKPCDGEKDDDNDNDEDWEQVHKAVTGLTDLHAALADCHRSLVYLDKFFKVVCEGGLGGLEGLAPSLMEVLVLLWRLGRRHGISGKVQIILECGVESLEAVVTRELRPVNLLPASMRDTQPFLECGRRVQKAVKVVKEWEAAVTDCTKVVHSSAKRQRDGRHDFDPSKVLGTIAGLRDVCTDLSDIMKVLLEAQVGFSGEWSALIRVQDPDQLKDVTSQVLRVLTAYDFNIFSARNKDRWVRQKEDFRLAVQKWEQAVVTAITESFKDRMTSELVTAVAGVLERDPCRDTFRKLLITRLPDLLSAFAAEVKGIRADFKTEQETQRPGTQAPLSGKVRWMTAYLTKRLAAWTTLKHLYSQYQDTGAGGELWAEVEAEVEEVQQEVKRARQEMVEGWGERVTQQIPKLLVTPVLTRDPGHKGVGGWRVQLPGELQSVVWESGQLLQAGIRPPELATHLTLHYHTLQTAAMGLHLTLKDYHAVLEQLTPVQRDLLGAELAGADRVLAAGQRVVTWSPAALVHFSARCRDVIEHVRALANKLSSITLHLEDHIASIRSTCLLHVAPDSTPAPHHPPTLQELVTTCRQRCDAAVEELVEMYERLVTTLGSAGLLVAGAEEGAPEPLAAHIRAAPDIKTRLAPFLIHWRQNVQEAVTMMLVGSIRSLEKQLKGEKLVFGVESTLTSTSTLTLTPPARTLTSLLADALGHAIRR